MKMYINEEYQDVGFWSFVKFHILAQLMVTAIVYGVFIVLFIIIAMMMAMVGY